MIKKQYLTFSILKLKASFTLIELVTVIAILGILAGIGAPLAITLVESFDYSLYRKDLSEKSNSALRRISRELRRIKDDTSVYTASQTTFSFVVDDSGDHTIQFNLNGTNLERIYDGTTDTLLSDVASLSFTYLDSSGTELSTVLANPDSTNIKFIDLAFTVSSGNNSIDYTLRIKPFNFTDLSSLF